MLKKILLIFVICGLFINSTSAYNITSDCTYTLIIDFNTDWAINDLIVYGYDYYNFTWVQIGSFPCMSISKVNRIRMENITYCTIRLYADTLQYVFPFFITGTGAYSDDYNLDHRNKNASYYCLVRTPYLRNPTFDFKKVSD